MHIGFEIIHASTVILRQKTVYKQVLGYKRNGQIYAKACGGFIRLNRTGGTSHPDVKWEEIDGIDCCTNKPDLRKYGPIEAIKAKKKRVRKNASKSK